MNKIILKSTATVATLMVIASIAAPSVFAADANYSTPGDVEFVTGDTGTKPVDPENPGATVDPENPDPSIPVLPPVEVTKGLSLDFASSLSFGQQKISSTDEIYYAHGQKVLDGSGTVSGIVPNYAQVTDVRGTFAGWTLSVATDGQFREKGTDMTATPEAGAPLGTYLSGAQLKFSKGVSNGTVTGAKPSNVNASTFALSTSDQVIMSAKANEGMGTWTYALGATSDYDASATAKDAVATQSPITLTVPGSTAKKASGYTTNLIWKRSDTPGN
ncbi:WxL domain-containing protein [Lactococcus garvieae]|uniref:WxL domain-containing protein n=1 Tax=Lactococcus garvieae TaxID=1363 RepID=UPI00254A4F95|nr:WxL domain-containing protein [Lactococcus garvieae]